MKTLYEVAPDQFEIPIDRRDPSKGTKVFTKDKTVEVVRYTTPLTREDLLRKPAR